MTAEIERALVGAALHDPDYVLTVCRDVLASPADVEDSRCRDVLTLLARAVEDGEPSDIVATADRVRAAGLPWSSDASSWLFGAYSDAPATASASWYAQQVATAAHRRRLAGLGTRLRQYADQPDYDPASASAALDSWVRELDETAPAAGPVPLGALVEPGLARLDQPAESGAVGTGSEALDKLIHGLRPGQLVVVAARPAVGKTTMALSLARDAAIQQQVPTLMFSLEMDAEEVFMRVLAAEARVPLSDLIEARLDDPQWARVARAYPRLQDAPLLIDDSADVGLPYLRATSRRMMRRHKVGLIVVDYLGLLAVSVGRDGSRQQAVGDITRGLKLLAKSADVPVVLVAQLNRDIEKRADKDKRPMLSDLRESGAIENDSDVVLLLHREEVYKPNTSRVGEVDVIVAKNRNGPTGTVPLIWSGKYARIAEPDVQTGLVEV